MTYRGVLLVVAALATQTAEAADRKFLDFVVGKANADGFTLCNTAIRDAFSLVDGADMRVITQKGLYPDSLKIIAVYGQPGDVIYQEAEVRRAGTKCRFTVTTVINDAASCPAELGALPAFKYEADTAGVIFTRNTGGVNMVLIPAGANGCTSVFVRDGEG